MLSQYQRRKQAGVCVVCGSEPATRGVSCEPCAARSNSHQKARTRAAATLGLCRVCFAVEAAPGRGGRCPECADRNAASCRAYKDKVAEIARAVPRRDARD